MIEKFYPRSLFSPSIPPTMHVIRKTLKAKNAPRFYSVGIIAIGPHSDLPENAAGAQRE
jgi:hypothetical protein